MSDGLMEEPACHNCDIYLLHNSRMSLQSSRVLKIDENVKSVMHLSA
jgi:hypothetical protein